MADILSRFSFGALRVFESAARLKSFTRAAEDLGVTQAAVSWQIKTLEQQLGQALFRRLPREVVLTPAGERLARAASEAVSGLRSAIEDLAETEQGVLVISTLQSLATQWLATRLGSFQLAHPHIAVRLETSGRVVDLHRENVDVAIRSGRGGWPGLAQHYLFPAALTPLCTPELRDRLGLSRPQDLLKAPRIGIEQEWAVWFASAGVQAAEPRDGPRLAADLQTVEVGSALAGHGVALGAAVLFALEIAAGRLVQPFEIPDEGFGYWLVYPEDRRRSPKISAFREWLLACVATDPVAVAAGPAIPNP